MSSKAFRVFNKRTRRVEENLHVEFLENKAIEKGAGPNWLLDIDSLTKSMNYVPMDAGTISTNLSGTKDATSQEVKKDVSSLRYIALPNWAYDALLESSSRSPQDHCSTEVPEGSGNLYPTASTSNPPANQMETLIMETPIPTTPSMDNILSLTNRFEDILGVTINSDESNGVEADISNMETAITASPTPTLRIHKDHPKKPKKISDALQDPSWVEAMQEELLQLKIQNVWTLVDCPKGVRPIGTKWVLKNKKDERGIVIRNKAKLVVQGHTQEEGIDYDEVFALVARIEAIRLFLAYASFMGFTVYQMDVKSAFLNSSIDEEVYMMQPLGFQDPKFLTKVYKVEKAMYGLHQAPRAWYAYSDSDYGGATQDHKSTTRGCQFLGRRLISWQCKKQTIMATSTTKAEYVAAASCCGQVMWIQNQLLDYGDCFEKKLISVDHTHTDENVADLLTKPFDAGRFQYLVVEHDVRLCQGNSQHLYFVKSEHNVNFHPMVDFIEASPLRYALTVKPTVYISHIRQFWSTARIETTEEGTKILATVDELFEIITLMGYNISPNQKFTFQKGQFSHKWKYLIHTIMQCISPKSTGFNEFSSNIATTLVCLATNKTYNFLKMIFDGLVKNVNNKDRETIAKSSTLPYDSAPKVTSPAADEGSMQQIINELTALCTSLRRQHSELLAKFQAQEVEINRLKERVRLLEDREGVAAKRSGVNAPIKGRNMDEGEAAAERVSDDTEEMATVLTSMDAATFLAGGVADIPTGSGSIPTASPPTDEVPTGSDVVPTASLVFATATVVTPYTRRKGKEVMEESETPKKQKVSRRLCQGSQILESTKKAMDQEAKEGLLYGYDQKLKTLFLWAQRKKAERFKRKGMSFEQESAKKQKTSEEVPKEVKSPDEVPKEKVKEMMQLVPIEEVYVEALQVKHPIIDWKRLVKETLSNRPPTSDKEMELWVAKLYDSCGVHHVTTKDKEIFMLVENDYPLRKGFTLVMISYKLQVENYSRMANDLILKIYKIASTPRQQGIEFPMAEEVPTASEEGCHCQKKREATARKIALLSKSRRNCQSKSNDSFT
nr:putative ribonuclease H-like domain-containing protein [Tanacetum cinerariifolium]